MKTHWHLHLKTTNGNFYVRKRAFTSLRKAKQMAKQYAKASPEWLEEVRIYRANTNCSHCD